MPAGFMQQTHMGGWVSGKELFWLVRVYRGVAWGRRVNRIDMFGPSTFDLGIFLGFDFDHWARKVHKLGFLITLASIKMICDLTHITSIQQHLEKAYNTNKAAFKAQHWVIDPETETYNVEKMRQARPEVITAEKWDKYMSHPQTGPGRNTCPEA
nr:hypothetical protein [Tanacetum cinerariifolium]